MKKIFAEFKMFAMRGNVIDLAVGIIIGAGFSSVVNSLVQDIIMPPVGFLLGQADFSDLYINLTRIRYESLQAAKEAGAATINYGLFINSVVSFVIVAASVFFLVKAINKLQNFRQHPEKIEVMTKECQFCKSTINLQATRCCYCTSDL